MKQADIVKLVIAFIVVLVVGAASFFLGDKHASESMKVISVTPTQAANAMKGDHFYSDYKHRTLLISGVVSSTNKSPHSLTVGFETRSSFKTLCDVSDTAAAVHPGQTIRVVAEGGTAERQSSAVLLQCTLL